MTEPRAAKKYGYYLLNTDGGNLRRRPGEPLSHAAIGALLRTRRLVTVDQISKAIGAATHNVAEYQALIEGLMLASAHGIERIRVYTDSELVVDQVNGVSAVRQAHELHEVASGLRAGFKSFRTVGCLGSGTSRQINSCGMLSQCPRPPPWPRLPQCCPSELACKCIKPGHEARVNAVDERGTVCEMPRPTWSRRMRCPATSSRPQRETLPGRQPIVPRRKGIGDAKSRPGWFAFAARRQAPSCSTGCHPRGFVSARPRVPHGRRGCRRPRVPRDAAAGSRASSSLRGARIA